MSKFISLPSPQFEYNWKSYQFGDTCSSTDYGSYYAVPKLNEFGPMTMFFSQMSSEAVAQGPLVSLAGNVGPDGHPYLSFVWASKVSGRLTDWASQMLTDLLVQCPLQLEFGNIERAYQVACWCTVELRQEILAMLIKGRIKPAIDHWILLPEF